MMSEILGRYEGQNHLRVRAPGGGVRRIICRPVCMLYRERRGRRRRRPPNRDIRHVHGEMRPGLPPERRRVDSDVRKDHAGQVREVHRNQSARGAGRVLQPPRLCLPVHVARRRVR